MSELVVSIDPTDSGKLLFSRPVTLAEAIRHLWTRPPDDANALRPDPNERAMSGRQRRYLINKKDLSNLFSLRHGLANEYVKRIQPIMSKAPATLPAWVPAPVRNDALSGRLPNGVSRFNGTPPYGQVVVWINKSSGFISIQAYQEFPQDLNFYIGIANGDERTGRLLHKVYTEFNRDMNYFVEGRGMSPEMARDEIRRINNELFKLVLEASVAVLASGAAITAMGEVMRRNAQQLARTAERVGLGKGLSSPLGAKLVDEFRRAGKRVVVNLGGTGEVAEAINLNPNQVAPRKGIPNLIEKAGEMIGEVFEPNSIDQIISNRLPPNTIDWKKVLPGAHKVLKPGGKIEIRFQGIGNDAPVIREQLEKLGFKNIEDPLGKGAAFFATK